MLFLGKQDWVSKIYQMWLVLLLSEKESFSLTLLEAISGVIAIGSMRWYKRVIKH